MKFTDTTLHQYTVAEVVHYAEAGVFQYEGDVGVLVEWLVRELNRQAELHDVLKDDSEVDSMLEDAHEQGYREGVRACIAKLEGMQ